MMALVSTLQLKGTRSTFLSVPSSRSRESKVNQFLPACHPVGRKDRLISLRCGRCLSVGTSLAHGRKSKLLKISAFQGSSQHDDSGGRAKGSKSLNNHTKVSYLQHKSEEPSVDSSKVQNIVPAPYTVSDDTATRSMAIQELFKKWLMLLRAPSRTEEIDGALGEPSPLETSEMQNTLQKQDRTEILKVVWCYFWGLDAAIKIPLLMFTPMYIAVNIIYGSEVSKELTPLWILGPLFMAIYVKTFRAICSLYVFTFKHTVQIVKKLALYSLLVYEYIFHGKLKEAVQIYLSKSLADIKNTDIRGWLYDKYLDGIESIWPFYCSSIRYLKRANLI